MKSESFGRVRYVEPTSPQNVNGNMDGGVDDSIAFPYEDYSMAVDLSIEIADRFSCGNTCDTNSIKTYLFSSENGSLSFVGGSKVDGHYNNERVLTTNYTDVSMTNPVDNTQECLGIESINITYNSWLYPQVTIRFVDVRGATVMQQAEENYYAKDDKDWHISKLYQALFTFPYPIFTLRVKGFYGKAVKYKLACQSTDIEFDSNVGSFVITAQFVGYMFGIYADMPMTFVAIAPYMKGGKEYWQDNIDSGVFRFKDVNGTPGSAFITIPELKKKLRKIVIDEEYTSAAAEGQQVESNYDARVEELKGISEKNPFNTFTCKTFGMPKNVSYNVGIKTNLLENIKATTVIILKEGDINSFTAKVSEYYAAIKEFDKKFSTNYCVKNLGAFKYVIENYLDMPVNSKKGDFDNLLRTIVKYEDGNIHLAGKKGFFGVAPDPGDLIGCMIYKYATAATVEYDKWEKEIMDYVVATQKNTGAYSFLVLPGNLSEISNDIASEETKRLYAEKTERMKEAREKMNEIIEKKLGFRPSIKNIFDLVFAHIDTFTHCYYETLDEIRSQLESDSTKRLKSTYSVAPGFSDTEDNSEISKRSDYLPPFTAYYKYRDTDKIKELQWAGELNNGDDLSEVKFVYNLLSAAKDYYDANRKADEDEGDTTTSSLLNAGIDVSTDTFIPATPYDFAYKGKGNPYNDLKADIDSPDFLGKLFFKFALRAKEYDMPLDVNAEETPYFAGLFGKIEAKNLYRAIGDKPSIGLFKFLKAYADGDNKLADTKYFMNVITGKRDEEGLSKVWKFGADNLNDNLYTGSGNNFQYCFNKKDKQKYNFLPLDLSSINRIKSDFAKGPNLINDPDYVTLSDRENLEYKGSFEYGKPLKCGDFIVLNTGTYVDKILENALRVDKDEAKKQQKEKEEEAKKESGDNATQEPVPVNEKTKDGVYMAKRETKNFSKLFGKDYALIKDDNDKSYICDKNIIVAGHKIDEDSGETDENYNKVGTEALQSWIAAESPDLNKVFLRYPCQINDTTKSPLYFKQYDGKSLIDYQDNNLSKAFLFLMSIPVQGRNFALYGDGTIKNPKQRVSVVLKIRLLREGAIYWRQDMIKNNGSDDLNQSDPIKLPDGYAHPGPDEFFTQGNDNKETIQISTSSGYVNIKEPIDLIPGGRVSSRRETIKQLFMKWATDTSDTGFVKNNTRLRDEKFYEDPKTGKLDIKLADPALKNTTAITSLNKEAQSLQAFLRDVYFGLYTTITTLPTVRFNEAHMQYAFYDFMRALRSIYKEDVDAVEDNPVEEAKKITEAATQDPFKSKDIRLAIYMSLKSLYDKWICSACGQKTWNLADSNSDFSNFTYIDTYYHDIGYLLNVNIDTVSDWLQTLLPSSELYAQDTSFHYQGKSVFEFLAGVAENCGGLLMALPQRFGLASEDDVINMFTPQPITTNWDEDTCSFLFMYSYKPSEHLGDGEDVDMNGWSQKGDGFDLTDEEITGELFNDDGYAIPGFGVTYAKQNQSIFKNITLTTKDAGVTEASLAATFNIAAQQEKKGPRETILYGQDIYRIYSQYSYSCGVEMMGNMQITPLMYFQLNNIPMWHGTYMVKKVTHDITAGNISTKFEGMRVNKYAIPLSDIGVISTALAPPRETTSGTLMTADGAVLSEEQPGDPNVQTPELDYTIANAISETNPLFVLTPAHSNDSKDAKKNENYWSSKVIELVKTALDGLNSGKPDNEKYLYYICNTNTPGQYNLSDARAFANKYGSEKVVSIVPHWNIGMGNRFDVFYGIDNGSTYKINKKSPYLAQCFKRGAEINKENKDFNGKRTKGGQDGAISTSGNFQAGNKNDVKDDALIWDNVTPPAVVLEMWFGDYYNKDCKDKITFTNGAVDLIPDGPNSQVFDGDGNYAVMGYWLLDLHGGRSEAAAIIVDGIMNYVSWLKGGKGAMEGVNITAQCGSQQTGDTSSFTPEGYSGEITNEKMKAVLKNFSSFTSQQYGEKYREKVRKGKPGYTYPKRIDGGEYNGEWILEKGTYVGCCTSGPSTWYKREGSDLSWTWWGTGGVGGSTYQETSGYLRGAGFRLIWHGHLADTANVTPNMLAPGDIGTFHVIDSSGRATSHGVMWTGKDWRSDCIQNRLSCYPGGKDRQGDHSVCIWRHPDYQEPGHTDFPDLP